GLFFFQAEDGIRDDLVTGVQTCALPIFGLALETERPAAAGGSRGHGRGDDRKAERSRVGKHVARVCEKGERARDHREDDLGGHRSEERRVGKEGRVEWRRTEGEGK